MPKIHPLPKTLSADGRYQIKNLQTGNICWVGVANGMWSVVNSFTGYCCYRNLISSIAVPYLVLQFIPDVKD